MFRISKLLHTLFLVVLLAKLSARAAPSMEPLVHQESCPIVLEPDQGVTVEEDVSSNSQNSFSTTSKYIHHSRSKTQNPTKMLSASRQIPRVINGSPVVSKRLREMMVFLVDFRQPSYCTGTLISPTWVLTAAHCRFFSSSSQVIIGSPTLSVDFDDVFLPETVTVSFDGDLGELIKIKRVINHPNYDDSFLEGSFSFDIALVELSEPSSSTNFMRLNSEHLLEEGSIARTSGYGLSSLSSGEGAFLVQVDLPIFPQNECEQFYPDVYSPDHHVCAGYKDRVCSSCFGDSGGPIFQYDVNDNAVQIGVTSFGRDCGIFNDPSVYVRPDAFIDWISAQGANFTVGAKLNAVLDEEIEIPLEDGGNNEEIFPPALETPDAGLFPVQNDRPRDNRVFLGPSIGIAVGLVLFFSACIIYTGRRKGAVESNPSDEENETIDETQDTSPVLVDNTEEDDGKCRTSPFPAEARTNLEMAQGSQNFV